ncbi:PhoD-like phosphatase-domain-containing protein [Fimicolochytrium jonesii]|uniref:PhoD-like phosphatase-domain-containing protein n=1 Tax=Fimicolochytrium jonesii TaxID=1396493 RepID=UPI0022FF0028|nr:PhoD-like phosphatase-domain-containing protein [Fimicolochytrium jonesii]KAI8827209.1 PhoD-like phosphatase-domain-containing protein [Fimicolochytrium jonesii]
MAKVLLTTLVWIYSLAAGLHGFLAPILLVVIPSRQVLRLIFLTYFFQFCLLPALVLVWYRDSIQPAAVEVKNQSSDDEDETRSLLPSPTSRDDSANGNVLRNRRNSEARSPTATSPGSALHSSESQGFFTFLKSRKMRTALLVLSFVANTTLFGLCMDFVYRPYLKEQHRDLQLTRVGAVGSDYARVFVRAPTEATLALEFTPAKEETWAVCESGVVVSAANDYTAIATCNQLAPKTTYHYRWVKADGQPLFADTKAADYRFKTAPVDLAKAKYSFAFTSCVKPGFPYMTKGIQGFREMGKQDLSFVMFLGDLIYADAPTLYGTDVDTYRWHYRYLYSHADFRDTFRRIPFLTIYDDHEILNDWEFDHADPYPAAFKAFNEYAGLTNPQKDANESAIFEYAFGDTAFFVMDTRGYRDPKTGTMLGDAQKKRVQDWLLRVKDKYTIKFLVSSVPLTQNWQWEQRDTWAGYLRERQEILDFISTNDIRNVMAISGDRHEVAVTKLPGNVIEFSTSPLQAFYSPIETYRETAEDQKIFSWRPGRIKWGRFTIDTTKSTPTATYALFVNDYQGMVHT